MGFDAARKDNFYATAFTHFGEWVTFSRVGQDDRRIKVNVRRTSRDAEGQHIDEQIDSAVVTVGRDEAHALGGIEHPQPLDKITRDNDPGGPYAWAQEVESETPYSFTLRFSRPRLQRLGQRAGA